jgi:hypothetical protein
MARPLPPVPAAGRPAPALFAGPLTLRVRGEVRTLVFTLVALTFVISGAQFLSFF